MTIHHAIAHMSDLIPVWGLNIWRSDFPHSVPFCGTLFGISGHATKRNQGAALRVLSD